MNDKLINITEVAKQLGVSIDCLRKWDKSGKLVALRTSGGHRRYKQSEITKLQGNEVEEGNQNTCKRRGLHTNHEDSGCHGPRRRRDKQN